MSDPGDHDDEVTAVAVSADGRHWASASRSGEVRLWRTGGYLLAAVSGLHTRRVYGAAFTADGRLVTAGDEVAVWTIEDGEFAEFRRLGWAGDAPRTMLLDPDRHLVVVAGGDNVGWRYLDGGRHALFPSAAHGGVAFTGAGLLVAAEDSRIHAWEVPLPRDERELWLDSDPLWTHHCDEPVAPRMLRCCGRGRLVVSPRRDRVVVLDAGTGAVVSAFVPPSQPTAVAGCADAARVVVGGRDGSLSWWDALTGHRLGHVDAHTDRIRALALSGDDMVLSGSRDGTAALWRMHDHAPVARFSPAPAGRRAAPYGRVDPFELTQAVGSPDGREWLVGGAGGQVHLLELSHDDRLRPRRVGTPARTSRRLDTELLTDDLDPTNPDDDTVRAARALARPGALDGCEQQARDDVVEALRELVFRAATRRVRQAAVIALAGIDEAEATLELSKVFHWKRVLDGTGRRLLAHVTGETDPTTDALVARLHEPIGNFEALLTAYALAERGAEAVPALHAALRAFPIPARSDTGHWFHDETVKYRLLAALGGIGPPAAPVVPLLLALRDDEEIYRDTRHAAERALDAIRGTGAAETLAAEPRG